MVHLKDQLLQQAGQHITTHRPSLILTVPSGSSYPCRHSNSSNFEFVPSSAKWLMFKAARHRSLTAGRSYRRNSQGANTCVKLQVTLAGVRASTNERTVLTEAERKRRGTREWKRRKNDRYVYIICNFVYTCLNLMSWIVIIIIIVISGRCCWLTAGQKHLSTFSTRLFLYLVTVRLFMSSCVCLGFPSHPGVPFYRLNCRPIVNSAKNMTDPSPFIYLMVNEMFLDLVCSLNHNAHVSCLSMFYLRVSFLKHF